MRTIISAGVLIKSGNKVLLCHATGLPRDKGWGLPKGRVDNGETITAAAVRETAEECGLDIPEHGLKEFTSVSYRSKDEYGAVRKDLKIFLYQGGEELQSAPLVCSTFFTPQNARNPNVKIPECDAFKWVSIEDAKSLAMKSIKSIFDLL